jgi:hypothetical protein
MISSMAMSAVASVRASGVLVTAIPAALAATRSIWSSPAPKLASRRARLPGWPSNSASILSVIVGQIASKLCNASASSARLRGRSSVLRQTS